MTRIFAPPTRDSFLRRDGALGSLLLVHCAALWMLLSPPGDSPSEGALLESLVVFLVPPDAPGPREAPSAGSGWSAGSDGAGDDRVAPAEPAEESVLARQQGEVPSLDAAALDVSSVAEPQEEALSVLEVDSAAVRDPTSAAPEYPAHLLTSGVEGLAEVRYVVDTLGIVDTLSFRVVRASHIDFAVSVRRALAHMRFRPAMQGGRRVRQLIEQPFRFQITPNREQVTPR